MKEKVKKKGQYIITYSYDKKKRTILSDKDGNVRTFNTEASAQKVASSSCRRKSFIKGKIRNPRVKKI